MILDFLLLDTIRYNHVKEGNVSGSINQDIYNDTNVTVTSDCYTRCQIVCTFQHNFCYRPLLISLSLGWSMIFAS